MSNVDYKWLNTLPDTILARIISFLPTRDAIKTVQLRTFANLWTTIDLLDFDDHPFHEESTRDEGYVTLKFIRFVRYCIMLHKCVKIRKFRVSFKYSLKYLSARYSIVYHECMDYKLVSEVEMWVKFALTRGVEVLDLNFGVLRQVEGKFKIPDFVWASESLAELRLLNCKVKPPNKVCTSLLKILTLNKVSINKESLCLVIGCCPLLQDLGITDCNELSELSFTAPNIRNLRVCMNYRHWKLTVNCPNVRSFCFSGCVEFIELINLFSVKKVSFDHKLDLIVKFFWYKGLRQFKRFLEQVQHAEILMLGSVPFTVLTYRVLENHPCPRNKWKRVVLHTWLSRAFIEEVSSLLRYSPWLEELIIYIINISDPSGYPPKCVELVELENGDYRPYEEDKWSFQCLNQCLNNVTMNGLLRSSCDAQIDLARIILKNALVLDKLTIFADCNAQSQEAIGFTGRELFEISKKLQAFQRVSKHASVNLLYSDTAKA
ncbi:putative F-box protein At1g49610 [Chenopodium quinoa]|uniref:putative F-box protein At1g49610 n=1 Tax=Chenopodium quinoa TaxID=63459 RepID=UPI000B798799|nr:putative F-box protein At1g49610 [Chenopodium quinoa]